MDYSTFKNSIMVPDQSAWQQIEFILVQSNHIDVFGFLDKQKINVCIPAEAITELGFQVYKPNLFSGVYSNTDNSVTLGNGFSNSDYVFSRVNGSLTPVNLQPIGFDVIVVESSSLYSFTFGGQLSLWDTTFMMQKLLKNKRSVVDHANIILARCLQTERKNVFVFVNDQKQIDQLKYEGIKYLRPDKLFAWMCRDGYINPRKGAWNFRKRRDHNNRWTNPKTSQKDNLG